MKLKQVLYKECSYWGLCYIGNIRVCVVIAFVMHHKLGDILCNGSCGQIVLVQTLLTGLFTCLNINVQLLFHYEEQRRQNALRSD